MRVLLIGVVLLDRVDSPACGVDGVYTVIVLQKRRGRHCRLNRGWQ